MHLPQGFKKQPHQMFIFIKSTTQEINLPSTNVTLKPFCKQISHNLLYNRFFFNYFFSWSFVFFVFFFTFERKVCLNKYHWSKSTCLFKKNLYRLYIYRSCSEICPRLINEQKYINKLTSHRCILTNHNTIKL